MGMDKTNGHFEIHNVGFYNLAPRQIKFLSYDKQTLKLAVSRDDASIEIWDMRDAVFMEKCILGQSSSSVEGIGWLDDRLFSTGQIGELIEWNLTELKPKQKVTLTGNAAWCMDIDKSNSCIAVGTYEGFMNIFSVNGDDLNFSKLFDKQEGAIRCCRYDSTGSFIVTGSNDTIRIWNVATGHAIHRMDTGRSEKNTETTVFSVVVLKDLTIMAGDSRGCITVWNGVNGTRIESIDALDAGVLAVAVNDEETTFCCSGVDAKIKIYVPIRKNTDTQRTWIRNLTRNVHSHDVQALTFIGENKIISGGVDGYINVSCSTKEKIVDKRQYGPFLPQPCAVVAMASRLLLLKYFNHLEVWRLGRPNDNIRLSDDSDGQKKFLSMDEKEEHIVLLRSRDEQPITCASISPNGMFLFYSTEATVLLYQLDAKTKNKKPSLTEVKVDSDKFTAPIAKVLFSSDSKSMYCVKSNGDIEIFSLSYNDEVDIKATISTKEGRNCAPTAMAIHNGSCRIVLAYSDYQIFERDIKTDAVVCVTSGDLKLRSLARTAINNILLDKNNENVVILHNDSFLFVLEKNKVITSTKRSRPDPSNDTLVHYELKTKRGGYEHFVHSAWLSSSELVAINLNPVTLIEQMHPRMRRKEFGNS